MRERETPSVLSPGIVITLAPVTKAPNVLFVRPGLANPCEKKSDGETEAASLQGKPLILIPAKREDFFRGVELKMRLEV